MPDLNTNTQGETMTDQTPEATAETPVDDVVTPEATPTAPKPAPPAEQPVGPEAEADEKADKVGNEAAKYRRQLRATETERDTLAGTVDALRKQLVNQNLPNGSKVNGEALWATGRTPAEFFTEDGNIDTDKLTSALQDTHKTLGMRFGLDPITDSGTGDHGGASEVTWADALKKR